MAAKFQYSRLARTVQRLIDRFGNEETITGFVDIPNTAQPNRPGSRLPLTSKINAVFLSIEEKHIDGELIKAGDMKVLLSPLDTEFDPQMTGTITRTANGEVWSIVGSIETLNPGGIKLLYILQVRK